MEVQKHLRNTFLAGIFAAIPLAVTGFVIWWVDNRTRALSKWLFDREWPGVGIFVALAAVYLMGVIATSVVGKFIFGMIDRWLARVPIVREIYSGWKQIALTPGGTEGVFSKVAMIPDETGQALLLGFTSGRGIESDDQTICVFVPGAPNPITGRLYFVRRERCRMVDISTEEALKVILSTGNYTPDRLGQATALAYAGQPVRRTD